MAHPDIVDSKEPIRLFKSDFLEFFTHIHPAVIMIIWLPVAVFFLVRAVQQHMTAGVSALRIVAGFVIGVAVWTLAEYVLHRFVFHFRPQTPSQERLSFLFHGVHHAQPRSKTRLVMPPAVSIPLALLFYGLYLLLVGVVLGADLWIAPLFAGFIVGYLLYDLIHYSLHHFPAKRGFFLMVRRHHMHHHFKTPDQRFGVSSPFWDVVFGTNPKD
ncbi:MAG: sterol desaturase family protein [Anaerolineae bacterium]|nr:sterol desaturase family protein [Anaerolineae bacterium]